MRKACLKATWMDGLKVNDAKGIPSGGEVFVGDIGTDSETLIFMAPIRNPLQRKPPESAATRG